MFGKINPIRYRGYYYDGETGFYYLNSRYYDPQVGRFINADDISIVSLDTTSLYDKNLYAYCDNNPINRKDNEGFLWTIATRMLVGAGLNVFTNWIGAKVTGQEFRLDDMLESVVFGAIGSIDLKSSIVTGVVEGIYNANKTYEETKSIGKAVANGVLTGFLSTCSAGNVVDLFGGTDDITAATVNLVFGTAYSSIGAAVSYTINPNKKNSINYANYRLSRISLNRTISTKSRYRRGCSSLW